MLQTAAKIGIVILWFLVVGALWRAVTYRSRMLKDRWAPEVDKSAVREQWNEFKK